MKFAFGNAFPLEIVKNILTKTIDNQDFKGVQLMQNQDFDDLTLDQMRTFAHQGSILSTEQENCQVPMLRIKYFESVENENIASVNPFYKNPYFTLLIIYKNLDELKDLKIPGQPYFFAIKENETKLENLFEIQTFSQKVVQVFNEDGSVKSILDRRSDFNGAEVRVIIRKEDKMQLLLPLVKKYFNFTTKSVKYESYGSKIDGKWNGAIRQLLDNELDLGKNSNSKT